MEINRKLKVLIVEDEILNAMALQLQMKQMGYETCHLAASGKQALQVADQEKPDVVLMDVHLCGGMNGVEAMRQIAGLADRSCPAVLYVTGDDNGDLMGEIEDTQPIGCVVKPYSADQIDSIIQGWIDKQV